jgi:Flp pilus assembly protein TadB
MSKEQVTGWLLAVAAIAVGYVQWGWRGVLLGITVLVFWLLLQFSRALRAMRTAAAAPKGQVASAVMLHARLKSGLHLTDVLRLTGSLGEPVSAEPEAYAWTDASGARVRVELRQGRVTAWALERPEGAAGGAAPDAG